MLKDPRAAQLSRNFAGQWLKARNVDQVPLNATVILKQEGSTAKVKLDADLRKAIRLETELFFDHIARTDRSVLELIDSDYTFLNEPLAKFYGIPGVEGKEMRKVTLPKDSPRGGVLTHASVLMVTSNPTRTSPVKRGLFVLDNFLGSPTPPPPADLEIPNLDEAAKEAKGEPTMRELMAMHRSMPLCARATPAWTRSAWGWRTSTLWACTAKRNTASPSTRPASSSPARASRTSTS